MRCDCIPNADLDLGGKLNANTNPDWRIGELNADPCHHVYPDPTSLIVPDFTIVVYSSSCNYCILFLTRSPLVFFLSIYCHLQGRMGCQEINGRKKLRENETNKIELPYT